MIARSYVFEPWRASDNNISLSRSEEIHHHALQDNFYLINIDLSNSLQHLLHIVGW